MSNVIVSREALMEIVEKRVEQILKKNHDYSDAWQSNGPFTPLMRIKEKLIRVETLQGVPALIQDEKVEDNIAEVFDYALLWLLWKSGQEPRQLSFIEWLREDIARSYGISKEILNKDLKHEIPAHVDDGVDEDLDSDGFPF